MSQPLLGDIVHFVAYDAYGKPRERPAMVMGFDKDDTLYLRVFTITHGDDMLSFVSYDGKDKKIGTWHWKTD